MLDVFHNGSQQISIYDVFEFSFSSTILFSVDLISIELRESILFKQSDVTDAPTQRLDVIEQRNAEYKINAKLFSVDVKCEQI